MNVPKPQASPKDFRCSGYSRSKKNHEAKMSFPSYKSTERSLFHDDLSVVNIGYASCRSVERPALHMPSPSRWLILVLIRYSILNYSHMLLIKVPMTVLDHWE